MNYEAEFEKWADEKYPGWRKLGPQVRGSRLEAFHLGVKTGLTHAAEICRKRAERRFEEHGYTEPDTNASYYIGEYAELGDSLDEESEDCARAIERTRDNG